MFDDYQKEVTRVYQEKKATNRLSLNLIHSTPAKLREECMVVFSDRYRQRDEGIIKLFFHPQQDAEAYLKAIKRTDADKFKPLDNFLKGNTGYTEEKNIELLAWLIDFEPRPYQYGLSYPVKPGSKPPLEGNINNSKTPLNVAVSSKKKSAFQQAWSNRLLICTLIIIICAGVWLARHIMAGEEKCMYWTGDAYQLVSCSRQMGNIPVYALDTVKVAHFKKIDRPDTLTSNALGRVWYSKINNEVTFYTSPGFDPVHVEKKLKPVTLYMLNKYAWHK